MSRRILIIDDSKVDRVVLSGFLKEEYDILEADNGEKALLMLEAEFKTVSAIVLDIVMPGIDGYAVLKQIRQNVAYQAIPIIITTGLEDERAHEDAIAYGADGFITKPYSRALLLHTVRNAIRLRETAAMLNNLWRDKLTGLLNREAFFSEAEKMIRGHRAGYYILSCFDVENFKVINDQYGTDKGDEILQHIAECVQNLASDAEGLSCRFTADRFAVLYPLGRINSQELDKIHNKAMSPDCINHRIKIRIGRYSVNDPSVPVSDMYDRATLAQESIKGRFDIYVVDYNDTMREGLLREQQIVNEMVGALRDGEFEPWFQPQYNHASGALIGCEALVRWNRSGQIIPPGDFIPVFEKNGFIYEIDQYIWRQVCCLLRRWIDEGKEPLPVSVNISRYDIFQKDFLNVLSGLLMEYRLPADMLRLEITESAFTESTNSIIDAVNELIKRGFIVEIDDFGSGYSSLNTLKDVPASILKLDMRFFENTGNQQRGGNIIESVVRMAKWLGMAVVAEGVEDREQADYLKSIGCYYIQGYYYAKPMPLCQYEKLLDTKRREPELYRLETLRNLNNNEFWNPKSMETLIFNSYVGGACIFEYLNGKAELLRINDQYTRELGSLVSANTELKSSGIVRFLDEKNKRELIQAINEAIDSRKEAHCEVRLSDGDKFEYVRITIRQIARAMERHLFYCAIVNITGQREAERKQIESAQRLEIIMSSINGGVSAIQISEDGTSKFIFSNERYYELYGYTREQAKAVNLDVMRTIVPEDFPGVMKKVAGLKADRKPVIVDYRCIKRDGRIAYLRANASLMYIEGYGDVITSVVTDITEQKSLEDQLKAILNHAGNGITAIALYGDTAKFLIANDKYFDIVGYTREEYVEKTKEDMLAVAHPDDREGLRLQVSEANKNGQGMDAEYRVIRRDGKTVWVKAVITIIELAGFDVPVQIAMFSDVTVEREANDQLRFLNDSAHNILAQPDSNIAIDQTLQSLMKYFDGDRAYVIELDYQKNVSNNTYESCADGVSSEIDKLKNIPFEVSDYWFEPLSNDRFIVIDDVSSLDDSKAELRNLLLEQKINSLIIAPLLRDGILVGYVGIDNPRRATDQLSRLKALGDYIAILLTRRDLSIEAEQQQKELLDNLPCGAALYEYDGRKLSVIHINRSYWQLVDREPKDYSEASVFDMIHPEDQAIIYQEIKAAIRQSRNVHVDVRILCGKFAYKPFHIDAKTMRQDNGKYLFFASYTPISDDTMSIQEMIPIALSTMMSASEDLSYVKDRDLHYICCSKSVAQLLGLSSEREIIGKTDFDLFDREQAEEFIERDRRIIEYGEALIGLTERLPAENGGTRLTSTSKYPIMDASGNVIGLYGISRDITAQKEKESQLELLTSSIPGGLAAYSIKDSGISMLYFNDGFYGFSGCSREEYTKIVAEDPLAFVFDEDKAEIRKMIKGFSQHKEDGHVNGCIFRCHTRDGGYRWMSMKTVLSKLNEDQYIVNVVQIDITEQQEEKERLRVSEELNRLAIEHSGNIITRFDVKSRTLTLPDSFDPIFVLPQILNNMPEEQITLGRVSPDTADTYRQLFESIIRGEETGMATYKQYSSKGWRWLEAKYTTVFSGTGEPVSAVISFTDITEELEKEVVYNKWQQSLNERPEDSYTLFRCNLSKGSSFDSWEGKLLGVAFDDADRSFDERTAEYLKQWVYEEDRGKYEAFLNSDTLLAEYHRGHRSHVLEYREMDSAGEVRWLQLTVDLVEYPSSKDVEVYLMYENIDEQKKAELLTLRKSETDPLTGILNRAAFIVKIDKVLHSSKAGENHALLMLDIDNFKNINDTMGHGAGDQVLRDLTSKISSILRRDDLIGRLGGDEFFVFMKGVSDSKAAEAKARQICDLRIMVKDTDTAVTASIGIAMVPKDGVDFDHLYKKADSALYRQKACGKNGFTFAD